MCAVSAEEKKMSVLDIFPDNTALAVSFNDGQGNASAMDGEISAPKMKDVEFGENGVSGNAMNGGSAAYDVKFDNLEFGKEATLVFWFAFSQTAQEIDKRLLIPLIVNGEQSRLIVARQGWGAGKCNFYTYVYLPDKQKAMSRVFGVGSVSKWKKGEWHMIAVTWTPNSLGISVDASIFDQVALSAPLPGVLKQIAVNAGKDCYMVDELIFFDRKLSQEELKKLYDAFASIKKDN